MHNDEDEVFLTSQSCLYHVHMAAEWALLYILYIIYMVLRHRIIWARISYLISDRIGTKPKSLGIHVFKNSWNI